MLTGIEGVNELALVLRPNPWGVCTYADLLYEALHSVDPALACAVGRARAATVDLEERITTVAGGRAVLLVLGRHRSAFEVLDCGAQSSSRVGRDECKRVRPSFGRTHDGPTTQPHLAVVRLIQYHEA